MLIEEQQQRQDINNHFTSARTKKGLLKVSEVFTSLQGEGPYRGLKAVFLRLAVCNLHCWYCDTKYTWLYNTRLLETVRSDIKRIGVQSPPPADLKAYDSRNEIMEMTLEEVELQLLNSKESHLVITGGEPMLQQSALIPLLQQLKKKKEQNNDYLFVEVETNGTVKPLPGILPLIDHWNVSPKLSSSGNAALTALERPETLSNFGELPNVIFKFVVQPMSDLGEIENIAQKYGIAPSKIALMPEGTEAQILNDRSTWLMKVCEDRGYQFSTRLQILLWGNKRGT